VVEAGIIIMILWLRTENTVMIHKYVNQTFKAGRRLQKLFCS